MICRHACLLLALCALPGTGRTEAALPEGFVHLETLAPAIRQDIRYHGRENFLGTRVDGYDAPRCILTRAAAEALARVQAELRPQGLSLKVFDCYRPQRAVAHFLRWARTPDVPALRARYHPNLDKRQLLREVYIADRSGHSRGSTVDVTIVRAPPP
jgi:zinc D-Ala-D-Ala dipeptidase